MDKSLPHVTLATPPMREAILRVDRRGLLSTIARMFSHVLSVRTTCLSELTETLGKQPLSRNVWWIRVNTRLDRILRSGKVLIFYNSSSRITIAKTIHKMHVAIFHVRKYERHFSNSVYQTLTTKPQRVPWRICRDMHFRRASAELVWRTGEQI